MYKSFILLFAFAIICLSFSACGRDSGDDESAATERESVNPIATDSQPEVPTATVEPQRVIVQRVQRATAEPGVLATRATPVQLGETLPNLAAHLDRVRLAMAQPIPVLPLTEGIDAAQEQAQQIALAEPRFVAETRVAQSGEPLRNEIFGIYPIRPSDLTAELASCESDPCYRVELYNYAYNLTTIATANLTQERVLTVERLLETQPDIPSQLTVVAQEIAAHAPEVATALGMQPAMVDATMANIKTALNASRCERSHHLCVAPTFLQNERALWAVVDLTEGTLVGVRWTELGAVAGVAPPTEKTLQDEVVTREFCEKSHTLTRDGWALDYILTSSDGLRISNLSFRGTAVLESAKLVDWHVSYSQQDGFGYSDAIGCPMFSQAAVVAFNGPQLETIVVDEKAVGFALSQHFKSEFWPAPCNYYYSQRYEFYLDGHFRIAFANHGRGCGNNGTYRPVVRIVPANVTQFAQWDGADWQPWLVEQWTGPLDETTVDGYQFRLLTENGNGYYLEPGRGQFDDGGRGDNPYLYVTRRHEMANTSNEAGNEGESDLITIGPCCNENYEQGPEKFINSPTPEPIQHEPIVLWYVAQMKNDDRPGQEYCWADTELRDGIFIPIDYPCFAGPNFTPIK